MDRDSDEFVSLLTASQPAIYGCILALLPDRAAAQDVLQETNLTLWHKADDFEAGTNFMAWASRIARYHVLNHRRKSHRERLIFDEHLIAELCERQADRIEDVNRYAELLRDCLNRLSPDQQDLLARRYTPGGSVKQIAATRGQSAAAISQLLYRLREALLNCVSERLQEGQT